MWRRLDDPDLLERYRGEHHAYATPAVIAAALADLAGRDWASRTWVVTSLGKMRFTTASSYRDVDAHGAVFIGQTGERDFVVFYVKAGAREGEVSASCTDANLSEVVAKMVDEHLLAGT